LLTYSKNLLNLKEMKWVQNNCEIGKCISIRGEANNDDSKKGKEDEKEENRDPSHM